MKRSTISPVARDGKRSSYHMKIWRTMRLLAFYGQSDDDMQPVRPDNKITTPLLETQKTRSSMVNIRHSLM